MTERAENMTTSYSWKCEFWREFESLNVFCVFIPKLLLLGASC